MFRPISAINHCLIAHKAYAFPTKALIEPRSLLPHFHGPGTSRAIVPKNVHGTLKAKMAIALFFLLLAALKLPIGLHFVAIIGVAVLFVKLGTVGSLDFTNIAITQGTVLLIDVGTLRPGHVPFGRIKKLKGMPCTPMARV